MLAVLLLSLALQGPPVLEEVRLLLAEGKVTEAEAAARRSLESTPQQVAPYLALARTQLAQDRPAAARETLETARSRLGDESVLLYELALLSIREQKLLEALALLTRLSGPDAPAGYWETLGRVHASLENWTAAEQAYLQLLESRPGSIPVLRALAGFSLKRGDTAAGWEYASRARRLAPNSPEVLYEFGQVSLAHGLPGEAAAAARLLLLLEPEDPRHPLLLARASIALNEHEQARGWLEDLAESSPDDGEVRLLLGVVHNRLGEFEQAEARLLEARRLLQDDLEASYLLGLVAYSRTRDGEAQEYLLEVLARRPGHGGAWLGLGKLRLRQQRFGEAIEALEKAARLLPSDADVHFQLSRAYRQTGDTERARDAVARYRQLKDEEAERQFQAGSLPFTRPDDDSGPP